MRSLYRRPPSNGVDTDVSPTPKGPSGLAVRLAERPASPKGLWPERLAGKIAKPLDANVFEVPARKLLLAAREENTMRRSCRTGHGALDHGSRDHGLAIPVASGAAHAQDAWPSRNITFIVPYAAGGYTDLVGRMTARYVESALGRTVIVDDRAGAGGIVGTQAVANAAPDGYTFCVCSIGAISIAPFVQKVGYDPIRDLAPIGVVSSIAQVVIVKRDLPVKSLGRARVLRQGASRKAQLRLQRCRRADPLFGRAVHDAHRNHGGAHSVQGRRAVDRRRHLRRGRFLVRQHDRRPAADRSGRGARDRRHVARAQRLLSRSADGAGRAVPGFVVDSWNAIIAPPNTPEPIIRRMSEILIKMADDPAMKESMRKAGADTVKSTPDEFRAQIAREIAQWKPLIGEIAEKK